MSKLSRAEAAGIIKEQVSAYDAGKRLGLKPNRAGYAVCPFHSDHSNSLKLYEDNRGFFCFGCGQGGDVVKLVEDMTGKSFPAALEWLNTTFGVGLDICVKADQKAVQQSKNDQERRELMRSVVKDCDSALFDAYCMAQMLCCELEAEKERYRPQFDDEDWDPRFISALRYSAEAREITEQLAIKIIGAKTS